MKKQQQKKVSLSFFIGMGYGFSQTDVVPHVIFSFVL
jgi:hypothetical protein